MTLTTGAYSAATMASGRVFYQFDFLPGSASRQEVVTTNPKTGGLKIVRTLKFTTHGLNTTTRRNLQAFDFFKILAGLIAVCLDEEMVSIRLDGYNRAFKRKP